LLTIVDQEAGRLSRLVTEATHLARIEAGKIQLNRQSHFVNSLVESVLEQMESRRDGRPIQVSIAPDLPSIVIDFELMHLALRQLLDNAVKYSPRETPIRITAGSTGEYLVVSVHNAGLPLSRAEQLCIFDKFYRGANVRHQVAGTGMGLAIAREILLAHGGDIRLDSSTERGTEFVVTLPVQVRSCDE
jgi:two-component system sensor histidine kinase KdpD